MTIATANPPEIPEGSPARCGAILRDYAGNAMFCGRPPHDRTVKHRSGEPPDVIEWVDPAGTGDVDRAQVAALGEAVDADDARIGGWFVDGTEDFYGHDEGTPRPECPHAGGTDAATWWHRGYSYAQRLWRAQCAERERDEARHALDDTRATIAAALAALGTVPGADLVTACATTRQKVEILHETIDVTRGTIAAALAALEAEPGSDIVRACHISRNTRDKLYDALDEARKERDEARRERDEALGVREVLERERDTATDAADLDHARAVRLADEVANLRARVAELEAPPVTGVASVLTCEALAARCGLVKREASKTWRAGWWAAGSPVADDSARGCDLHVFQDAAGSWWSTDCAGIFPTELDALTAYARATGVDLGAAPAAPQPAPSARPAHYDLTPEPIDAIEGWDLAFNLGNVVKYIARAGRKAGSTRLDDLRKAARYLEREIARETRNTTDRSTP